MLPVDNSAWARLSQPHVEEARLAEIAQWMTSGKISTDDRAGAVLHYDGAST
jgi:hypothetical protein